MSVSSSVEKVRCSSVVATEITAITRSALTSGMYAALFAPVAAASRRLIRESLMSSTAKPVASLTAAAIPEGSRTRSVRSSFHQAMSEPCDRAR